MYDGNGGLNSNINLLISNVFSGLLMNPELVEIYHQQAVPFLSLRFELTIDGHTVKYEKELPCLKSDFTVNSITLDKDSIVF